MKTILDYGSINIDHVYRVPHFVRPGETLANRSYTRGSGGKGFNQSIALRRAGASVAHVGRYGTDAASLRDLLDKEQIAVENLTPVAKPSGHAIIQVDDAGQNAIILHAGANHAITAPDLPTLFTTAQKGDWFLTQNETSCVPEALTMARARGLVVCFNPAPMTPEVNNFDLTIIDWLIVNETEGEALCGHTDPPAILSALRLRSPHAHIILTLGSEGVLCLTPDGQTLTARPPHVQPLDTTAAGDTFIGYLLASAMQGEDLPAALDLACRAAALSVTRPGAADSIPILSELR